MDPRVLNPFDHTINIYKLGRLTSDIAILSALDEWFTDKERLTIGYSFFRRART